MRFWNISDGAWTTFISSKAGASNEGKWFVYTHDGYWNSNQGGDDLVAFVKYSLTDYPKVLKVNDEIVLKYKRPDIIADRLK